MARGKVKVEIGQIPKIVGYTLGYLYTGSSTMYFTLMVPTEMGWAVAEYTHPLAIWLRNIATLLAPISALILWLLLATFMGVTLVVVCKGTYHLYSIAAGKSGGMR